VPPGRRLLISVCPALLVLVSVQHRLRLAAAPAYVARIAQGRVPTVINPR
jgi:hypothetical protein